MLVLNIPQRKLLNKNTHIKSNGILSIYIWHKYVLLRYMPSKNYFIHLFIQSTNLQWGPSKDQASAKHWTCNIERDPFLLLKSSKSIKETQEFPLWLSGLRPQVVSMRMQVRSLPSLSGLRIRWHRKLQHRSKMWLRPSVAVPVV